MSSETLRCLTTMGELFRYVISLCFLEPFCLFVFLHFCSCRCAAERRLASLRRPPTVSAKTKRRGSVSRFAPRGFVKVSRSSCVSSTSIDSFLLLHMDTAEIPASSHRPEITAQCVPRGASYFTRPTIKSLGPDKFTRRTSANPAVFIQPLYSSSL